MWHIKVVYGMQLCDPPSPQHYPLLCPICPSLSVFLCVALRPCLSLAARQHIIDIKTLLFFSFQERLSDFHLLLWLSKQPNLDQSDMSLLVDCVSTQSPVLEGYRLIVDSIAA